jgi:hypothetical protein
MKFSVEDYCSKLGWYLVTIPAGTKGPTKFGWQQPEKALSDPEEARKYYEQNPTHNVGLLHGASGTCAIDIDNVEHTKMIFDELGIDFSEMMQAAPQIIGRENRGKLIFKAPARSNNPQDILASPRRSTQDRSGIRAARWICARCPAALNPPRHWQVHMSGQAGQSLMAFQIYRRSYSPLWRRVGSSFRPQLQDICPWKKTPSFQPPNKTRPKGDGTSVIDTFNASHDMHTLLEQYGYKRTGQNRYLSPNSTSGLAGVKLFEDGRAYSHHASDPFDSAHSFDAFELWCQYEHRGNVSKAVKDAAQLLNVTQDPNHEYDKEAIEHGAKVAAQIMSKPKASQGPLDTVPEHLLSVPGILQDVVNYYTTTAIKPQPQFAVQAAIAFGSVAMGRRWVTDQRNFSSLYFLNIGETGSGKEHTKTVLRRSARTVGPRRSYWPSRVYVRIRCHLSPDQKTRTCLAVIDELGRQLKAAAAKGMQHKADAITSIMEVFGRQDGTLRQAGYATNTMKSSEAEKLEKVIKRPSLTLVGMSTPSEFFQAIGGGDVASGLLNRFIIVRSEIGVRCHKKSAGRPYQIVWQLGPRNTHTHMRAT